jgi:DNA-binding transcriptional MerR regulator
MSLRVRASTITLAPARPRADVQLSADDVAAAVGISRATLARLVRMGLAEPVTPDGSVFTASVVARLRRMLRLRADLGVNLVGAAIILDLVERLDRAYAESKEKR